MANEVLVALDGSEKDGRAVAAALAVADLVNAHVDLVRVIPRVSDRVLNQAELVGLNRWQGGDRVEVEQQLARQATSLTTTAGRRIDWHVLEGASVSRLLVEAAECPDVQAIVMGTRGPTQVGLLVGSVADQVMRESPKAVVLVPPGAADLAGRPVRFERLLVPLDGSNLAAHSVDFLLSLPRTHALELVMLEVVASPHEVATAERRLRDLADRASSASVSAAQHVIVSDNTAKAIAGAVRELFVDMIAMSTRGLGGLRRLVLGSVAQSVVRAAETPILLLTPAMLAAAVLTPSKSALETAR